MTEKVIKKVKNVYFKEGDVITLFPGWTDQKYSRIRSQKEVGTDDIASGLL
jgi:hypothetical protein